jgi:1-aminocyclopropane-1-carboxylate deaminase/D-cysteine desulfhydrase-like pyridoxal-dependent ACC family enzyme
MYRQKIQLINEYTPLHALKYSTSNTKIYMKRDDLIGFGGGGNKVRLFEYISADIVKSGAEKIITFGSIHSNHVRVTAVIATMLHCECDLIILEDSEEIDDKNVLSPNLLLTQYCQDIHIVKCKTSDAKEFIDDYLDRQRAIGKKYYWIPGGGHMDIALQGYADAAEEILKQTEDMAVKLDAIFVPCGTGTTQAGLIKGINGTVPVFGVSVARSVERCEEEIGKLLKDDDYKKLIKVLPKSVGYGESDFRVDKMIKDIVRSDGIYLDPIYNAKSFFAMIKYLEDHIELRNILYLNTGGTPNLFVK